MNPGKNRIDFFANCVVSCNVLNQMIDLYRVYKEKEDQETGSTIANYFYRQLNYWIEYGKPEETFLAGFWKFWAEAQDIIGAPADLIDLGLAQTAEALSLYKDDPGPVSSDYYIYEARLPFLAFLDEQGYRMARSIEFSEIDFHIFEIIGGDFPEEVAQNFLKENEWADIWTSLRYLDSLDPIHESEVRISILERMLAIRKTVQEKLIILAYIFYSDRGILTGDDPLEITLPSDFPPEFIRSLIHITGEFYEEGSLSVNFEERLNDQFENESVFFLLSLFEISQMEVSPSWIRVLELGMQKIWTYPFPELDGTMKIHQPMQEFTASILSLLSDEDLGQILESSLVLPIFFENLDRYNTEIFLHLLGTFSRKDELLLQELLIAMPGSIQQEREQEFLQGRHQEIASYLGKEIKIRNGIPLIRHSDGSIN